MLDVPDPTDVEEFRPLGRTFYRQEVKEVDETKGAILSGSVKMLPGQSRWPGEDLGLETCLLKWQEPHSIFEVAYIVAIMTWSEPSAVNEFLEE